MFCVCFSIQNSEKSLVMVDSCCQNIIKFSEFLPTLKFIEFIIFYLSLIVIGQDGVLQDNENLRCPLTSYHSYKSRLQIYFLLLNPFKTANIQNSKSTNSSLLSLSHYVQLPRRSIEGARDDLLMIKTRQNQLRALVCDCCFLLALLAYWEWKVQYLSSSITNY